MSMAFSNTKDELNMSKGVTLCYRQLLIAGKPSPGSLILVSRKTVSASHDPAPVEYSRLIILSDVEPYSHLTFNYYTKYTQGLEILEKLGLFCSIA